MRIVIALLMLALAACTTPPTNYVPATAGPTMPKLGSQPVTPMDERFGYSESQISPSIVRVNFSGSAGTNDTRAVDFALLRAAEVALEQGYPYFVVRDHDNKSTSNTSTTTSTGFPTTTCNKKGLCTTTYGPSTTTSTTTRWPTHENLIELFAEVPPDSETLFVLEARFVQRVLREKYELENPAASSMKGAIE